MYIFFNSITNSIINTTYILCEFYVLNFNFKLNFEEIQFQIKKYGYIIVNRNLLR